MRWQTEKDAGNELIDKLKHISEVAREKINDPGIFIPPEDFNNPGMRQKALSDRRYWSAAYQQLTGEPLIAAVLVEAENGERKVYYFARRARVDGVDKYFTHTFSPLGPLVEYGPGDEYSLPNGTDVTVVSKFVLSPKQEQGIWDSRPTYVHWDEETTKPLVSLKEFLSSTGVSLDGWDILEEEVEFTSSRIALRGTGLRDQAVLDKVQGGIFRLPLSSQLMISGPPGSGKTTTLIRRMAQKNEISFLSPEEKVTVGKVSGNDRPHSESWIMFTPTELLEGYLSEAFNREGVPAPKERIWTWAKFSIDLAREEARILRKGDNRSGFKCDESAKHLARKIHDEPEEWLQRFEAWLSEEHLKELSIANEKLQFAQEAEIRTISSRIGHLLTGKNATNLFLIFENLAAFSTEIGTWRKNILDQWRDLTDRQIERFGRLNAQNVNKLNALVAEVENVSNITSSDEDEHEDEDYDFDEKLTTQTRKDRIIAVVRQSLNARAREKFNRRKAPQRYVNLLTFIGNDILDEIQLEKLGRDLELLSGLSRIFRANTAYFSTMSTRYRIFRKVEPDWYEEKAIARDKIDRDELDALILTKLKAVHALLPRVDLDEGFWSALRPLAHKLRNQIYVDEATDFSEIQLAAMYHLSHPQVRSFFMSGDFDQRLTEWGIKDNMALQRAIPGIVVHAVQVGYRQSVKLKSFIDTMRQKWLGHEPNSVQPKFGQYEGFNPVMFEAKGDLDAQARWIADRIHEVDGKHDRLPSIAILVARSEDVKPLAIRLEGLLENIPVAVREEAGNLGRDEEVRIFPIHHIKGLEFEAAFFVGVDQLKKDVPNLFHRYLYVGATRAATFLGFAANDTMPSEITDMRDMFVSAWGK